MTAAEMKETVRKVWAALRDDQIDNAFSYMTEDVRWDSGGDLAGEISGLGSIFATAKSRRCGNILTQRSPPRRSQACCGEFELVIIAGERGTSEPRP
jgi:hypothetical protein